MNLHSHVASNKLKVLAEPKETTLRLYEADGSHIFNCQITSASLTTARITAGTVMPGAQFSTSMHRAIVEYLLSQGFTHATLERESKGGQGFNVITRKLKRGK